MLTELILSELPNASITMLDFSREMLESSQVFFEMKNLPLANINYMVKNFITDDFYNETYDLIISSYALHHIRNNEDLKNVYLKVANSLKEDGTFLCIDNYLETDDYQRNKQVKVALEKWTQNYNSKEKAKEWANIIRSEDTPATIPLIITLLEECTTNMDITPFISPKRGVMAMIYGMTKLELDKIKKLGLYNFVEEKQKFIGKEEKIAPYPFNIYL